MRTHLVLKHFILRSDLLVFQLFIESKLLLPFIKKVQSFVGKGQDCRRNEIEREKLRMLRPCKKVMELAQTKQQFYGHPTQRHPKNDANSCK